MCWENHAAIYFLEKKRRKEEEIRKRKKEKKKRTVLGICRNRKALLYIYVLPMDLYGSGKSIWSGSSYHISVISQQ